MRPILTSRGLYFCYFASHLSVFFLQTFDYLGKHHSMPILLLSIFQALLITSLLFIKITGNFHDYYKYLLILSCISAVILFFLSYPVFRTLSSVLKQRTNSGGLAAQSHYLLHVVIFSFIVLDQFHGFNYKIMVVFSPYLIAFFLTAVVTWRSCYLVFSFKIYKFFILGSTALLVWSTILTFLGLLYQEDFLSDKLHFLLLCYFVLHFAELGFVILKIKSDLKTI